MRLRKGFELDGGGVGVSVLGRLAFGLNVALYQDFLFSRHCVVYVPLFSGSSVFRMLALSLGIFSSL